MSGGELAVKPRKKFRLVGVSQRIGLKKAAGKNRPNRSGTRAILPLKGKEESHLPPLRKRPAKRKIQALAGERQALGGEGIPRI